jgi:hypothetical protein
MKSYIRSAIGPEGESWAGTVNRKRNEPWDEGFFFVRASLISYSVAELWGHDCRVQVFLFIEPLSSPFCNELHAFIFLVMASLEHLWSS